MHYLQLQGNIMLCDFYWVSRIVYTAVYWAQLQPYRSIAFALGNFVLMTMAVWAVVIVFVDTFAV